MLFRVASGQVWYLVLTLQPYKRVPGLVDSHIGCSVKLIDKNAHGVLGNLCSVPYTLQ